MRAITNKQSTLKQVTLRCKICGAEYKTKNIGSIGSRSIFPVGKNCCHSIKDLELVEPEEIDLESFRQELELFREQARTQKEIDMIFMRDYGFKPSDIGLA